MLFYHLSIFIIKEKAGNVIDVRQNSGKELNFGSVGLVDWADFLQDWALNLGIGRIKRKIGPIPCSFGRSERWIRRIPSWIGRLPMIFRRIS